MCIEKAALSDAETVYKITKTAIEHTYPHYYAKGAVAFFLEHHSKGHIASDIQSGTVFLCYDSQRNAVGTVTLKGNEICRLFVLPPYQNKGFGRRLLDYAEMVIFREYDSVALAASLPAKRIYRKRGYQETESHIIQAKYGDFLCYDVMQKHR